MGDPLTPAQVLIVKLGECIDGLTADLSAARAALDATTEALRSEVRKRYYDTAGGQPDTAWIDAKIAEMYPALAASGQTGEATGYTDGLSIDLAAPSVGQTGEASCEERRRMTELLERRRRERAG